MSFVTIDSLDIKFCPRCGRGLSYTSYEGYCIYADCHWNNEEADDCTPPASTTSVPAGLVAQATGSGGECSGIHAIAVYAEPRSPRYEDIRADYYDADFYQSWSPIDASSYVPAGSHRTFVSSVGHGGFMADGLLASRF